MLNTAHPALQSKDRGFRPTPSVLAANMGVRRRVMRTERAAAQGDDDFFASVFERARCHRLDSKGSRDALVSPDVDSHTDVEVERDVPAHNVQNHAEQRQGGADEKGRGEQCTFA